ncbi:MAG: heparinase II/III-family protein [Proteobacteria bacterium]|nr:heparinase II/III-family protein [Pseudomonadota bacterium]MBU4287582.1 heparinase II/III-family protein [Pseudomonadota bacterium]MBU4415280.1 heparinase II/III-family protein [Pseudomonadota bacterium]MCG2830128.1 heparinase II/III-family protein [Desulfobacteraceae bacterium]
MKEFIIKIVRFCRNFFALIGICASILGIYGLYWAMNHYDMNLSQFVVKAAQKAGIQSSVVTKALSPPSRFANHTFKGTLIKSHPRILYSKSMLDDIRELYKSNPEYAKLCNNTCNGRELLWKTACWATSANQKAGAKAIEQLIAMIPQEPKVSSDDCGNGLEMALAYDLLYHHPAMTETRHHQIQLKLEEMTRQYLVALDDDSASLWHGRTSLAASAWITALSLDESRKTSLELLTRAQAHFLDVLRALEITEGWPEGYGYWINRRAFPLVLACLGHINAVEAPEVNTRIKHLLERIGYWHIYGTRPIGGFEPFGDSASRVDLKDETRRVIDLISLATDNPSFSAYSAYLETMHRQESYYRDYRWGVPLFQYKTFGDNFHSEPPKDLSIFNGILPKSMVFGPDSWGQVYIHSDWGPDSTFISYRSGNTFAHHGHYDSGHFTLFKGAPLAITSGTYGDYTSPHRLNYAIRTVSKNSILVLRPNEKVKPNRFFMTNVADGGQRIVMPTGSAITSVADWNENIGKGRHYEGGKLLVYKNAEPDFVYINSDLTNAYNSKYYDDNGKNGKVNLVNRQMVYLFADDALIIYDEVESTQKDYIKKWLLHCWAKPETVREKVLIGEINNGILQSSDSIATIDNGKSKLMVERLLPEDGIFRKVGGPDYRYYVEVDGDETRLDGINFIEGANEKPWYDSGMWRLEIQPRTPRTHDQFLVVLKPSIGEVNWPSSLLVKTLNSNGFGAIVGKTLVIFGDIKESPQILKYQVPGNRVQQHVIVNLPPEQTVMVTIGGEMKPCHTTQEGTLRFDDSVKESHEVVIDFESRN